MTRRIPLAELRGISTPATAPDEQVSHLAFFQGVTMGIFISSFFWAGLIWGVA